MKFKFRNLFIIIFSCFILLSCLSGYNGNLKKVSLNRVIDGDTIKVSIDGKLENVRLLLIDAPELRGSYPYSSEARKFLERRLSDDEYVYLEMDGKERDNYGRLLAYVWYYDGDKLKMLNEDVVGEGLARVAYIFEGAKHLEILNLAQENAKVKGENIWSIEGYVTDSGFKKQN